MLSKLIKYDFIYSSKLFFAFGAIAMAIAFILGGVDSIYQGQRSMYWGHRMELLGQQQSIIFAPNTFFMQILALLIFPIGAVAAIHIAQFYRKNMFGHAGYLAMTMPVNRGTILTSKLIVSFAWTLYSIAVMLAMVAITHVVSPYLAVSDFFIFIDIGTLVSGLNITFVALAAICLLFFCITLSHSVICGRRVKAVLSGIFGFLYSWLYASLADLLAGRFSQGGIGIYHQPGRGSTTHIIVRPPLTGLQYGRIVVGQRPWGGPDVFIDIWFLAFTLVAAAVAIIATRYLLARKVSLQ